MNNTLSMAAIGIASLMMLVACDSETDTRMSCSESFDIGMQGAWSIETTKNKERCAADYEKWLASTPPSQYEVIGRSLKIDKKVFSLEGMVVERDASYLREITDKPQPSVYVSQGKKNALLRFQNDAQADAAFKEISAAIAGTSSLSASVELVSSN